MARLADEATQDQLWAALEKLRDIVVGVFQGAGEHQPVELTLHEEILGATAAFLCARGDRMVRWRSHTHRRHRQKSCPVLGANDLLTVFAIAGLLELTEQWQRVPAVTGEGTRSVKITWMHSTPGVTASLFSMRET